MTKRRKQTIWVMVGIIASGKSSWAKMKANTNSMTSIVSKDDIRKMLNGVYKFDEVLEEIVDKIARDAIYDVLHAGRDLIVDECNIKHNGRCKLRGYIWGSFPRARIVGVCCPSNVNNLDRRLKETKGINEYEWTQACKRMLAEFEEIKEDEFDEVIYVNTELE